MNILLVEDNQEYLEFMREALSLNGYNVMTALDGLQACEYLDRKDLDLIICDIKMPHCNGIEFRSITRSREAHKRTKFLLLSGYKQSYENEVALEPGIDFFLDKSTSIRDILRFVDGLLFGDFATTWVK